MLSKLTFSLRGIFDYVKTPTRGAMIRACKRKYHYFPPSFFFLPDGIDAFFNVFFPVHNGVG